MSNKEKMFALELLFQPISGVESFITGNARFIPTLGFTSHSYIQEMDMIINDVAERAEMGMLLYEVVKREYYIESQLGREFVFTFNATDGLVLHLAVDTAPDADVMLEEYEKVVRAIRERASEVLDKWGSEELHEYSEIDGAAYKDLIKPLHTKGLKLEPTLPENEHIVNLLQTIPTPILSLGSDVFDLTAEATDELGQRWLNDLIVLFNQAPVMYKGNWIVDADKMTLDQAKALVFEVNYYIEVLLDYLQNFAGIADETAADDFISDWLEPKE